ncbi:DUF533 domain-containing protein [Candidatus Electrothrix sp.]|uniref:DUF533 domain-containing protein n=1 Tax=Candidatus Electrothrix sp. TaxID=2170559 RepID=UPI004055E534
MDVEKLLGKLLHEATGSGGKHFKKKYKKHKKKYKGKKGYVQHHSSSHQGKSSLLGNLTGNLTSGKGLLTAIGLGVGAYEIYRTGQQAKQRQTAGGMGAQYSQPSYAPAGPAGPTQTAPPPPPPPPSHMQQAQGTSPAQQEPVAVEPAMEPVHTGLSEQDVACRLIQVMVGAAHADGTLDSEEEKAILDRLRDVELAQEEKMFLLEELHHPRSIADLTQGIEDIRLGQAMYAVAASAVNIDTESERQWFDELGTALGLSPEVCQFIEENQ